MNGQSDNTMEMQAEFSRRLLGEWLPAFCHDPNRNFSIEGFKLDSINVDTQDARDFMRALDTKIVTDAGGGRFRMPQSKAYEQLFWTGSKAVMPRPLTLWIEPVITIAAMARLHLDYGWPIACLGTQSKKWEFDLMAFNPLDLRNEYIAGEVKKTEKELNVFLVNLHKSCSEGDIDVHSLSDARKNAHKKWLGLRRCRAPLFWALGPNGYSHIFEVSHSPDGVISLQETTDDQLFFSATS